jgi:hypothetical protein
MQYRQLGQGPLKVSELSFGTWLTVAGGIGHEQAIRCIHAALDHGITLFDTANQYGAGEAERVLGEALRGHPRHSYMIATKLYFPVGDEPDHGLSAPQIEKQLDRSLQRLGVDVIDLYQCHRYDKDFKEIWSYDVPTPWAAIRLKNGNTLITDERDVKTFEVTPDKKIVWQITPADLPAQYRYENSQSATRLANGNTILCSRGGSNEGPQMVEVTRAKKVVWVLQDWTDFGPASAVQILDDPGIPEHPGDSQH